MPFSRQRNETCILIVDDSITVRMSLSTLLDKHGYKTVLAPNGEEAIEVLASEPIDAIILDLVMPGMTGTDVLKTIKSNPTSQFIPVALLTAVNEVNDVVTNIELGADDYLTKPWDNRELLARLRAMVRLKQASDLARKNEAMARALLNVPTQVAILVDPAGRILSANQHANELLNVSGKSIEGQHIANVLSTEKAAIWTVHLENCVLHARSERFEDHWNGTDFDVGIHPIDEGNGYASGCAIVAHDITARKRAESEEKRLNAMLIETSRKAGMAEVAIDVLHNVGNVLNSVNTSVSCMANTVQNSHVVKLVKAIDLIQQHDDNLEDFFANNDKGRKLPAFLHKVSHHVTQEHEKLLDEIKELFGFVEHLKDVVASQQAMSRHGGFVTEFDFVDMVKEVLQLHSDLNAHGIDVQCEFPNEPIIGASEKHKLMAIVLNLITNAKDAVFGKEDKGDLRISVKVKQIESAVSIVVADTGIGIPPENLTQIFFHGFTTKPDGHGFGLHSCALNAKELGGTLEADSAGIGCGATFTLNIPLRNKSGSSSTDLLDNHELQEVQVC